MGEGEGPTDSQIQHRAVFGGWQPEVNGRKYGRGPFGTEMHLHEL